VSLTADPAVSSLVATDAELVSACARWSAAGIVGIDTEFFRERTYCPRPALVQVADTDGVTLVDPLGISEFAPLRVLLCDPAVRKLMHAHGEDLDVFEVLTGAVPVNVFDTQRAGAFAGHGFSLGYRSLVEALLGVVLDKGETRSDWLRRPLSPAQLRYAALDVAYLPPLYERLSRDLATLGRTDWFAEEREHQRRARALDKRPEAAYVRVKGRGALSPPHHATLRALCAWRETEAMALDVPRRHLVTDEVLLTLARLPVPSPALLAEVKGLSPHVEARYGQALLACIETARAEGTIDADAPIDMRPYAKDIKRLKEIVRRTSEAHNMPAELLANRRALEALVVAVRRKGGDIPPEFRGWRHEVITDALLESLHDGG